MTSFNRLPVFRELETKELDNNYIEKEKELLEIIKQDEEKYLNEKKRKMLDILKNVLQIDINPELEIRFLDNSIYTLNTIIGREFLLQVQNALDKINDDTLKTNLIEIYQSIIVHFSSSQSKGSNIELFLKFLFSLENVKRLIIFNKKNVILNKFKEYIKGEINVSYESIFLNFETPKPFAALSLPVISKISFLKGQTDIKNELIDELEKIKIALEQIKDLTNDDFYKLIIENNQLSDTQFFYSIIRGLPQRFTIKYTLKN